MPISDSTLAPFGGVRITPDMKDAARYEITRREPHIVHHFTTEHFTQEQSDMIGFYGEFAFRSLLATDWKAGIREDYLTINSNDVLLNGWVIDVKTESIPATYIWTVLKRIIADNDWYGRRLYHTGQAGLLPKYDIIVFGTVLRENSFEAIDAWFPIGWLPASQVSTYPSGKKGPQHYSGKQIWYPFPAYQITTADLHTMEQLLELIKKPKANP
jgi:hypothetical protein